MPSTMRPKRWCGLLSMRVSACLPSKPMSHGTPVITSNVSSLPEVVGDTALSVDPRDTAAIVEAMSRLLADPDLAAGPGPAGTRTRSRVHLAPECPAYP